MGDSMARKRSFTTAGLSSVGSRNSNPEFDKGSLFASTLSLGVKAIGGGGGLLVGGGG
jgi:hypothetical protein